MHPQQNSCMFVTRSLLRTAGVLVWRTSIFGMTSARGETFSSCLPLFGSGMLPSTYHCTWSKAWPKDSAVKWESVTLCPQDWTPLFQTGSLGYAMYASLHWSEKVNTVLPYDMSIIHHVVVLLWHGNDAPSLMLSLKRKQVWGKA